MDISSISSAIVASQTAPAAVEAVENDTENIASDIPADQMGSRLAILAKKEKSIREQHTSYAQKIKELEEREAKLAKYQSFDEINDDNAVDFLKSKNLSLEKVQEKWLSTYTDEDLDPIQKQIRDLQKQLADSKDESKKYLDETLSKKDQDKRDQEIEEQSKYYAGELNKFLSENVEKYDLITTFAASDEVFRVIKDVYLETSKTGNPKLMTFEEASEAYEGKLAEQVQAMSKSKKVRELMGNYEEPQEDHLAHLTGQNTIDSSFSQSSAHSAELKTQAERDRAAAKLFEQMRG